MKKVSEIIGANLEWREPKATVQHYELHAGKELCGTLDFRSAWGTLATAETAGGTWTFKRVGFLNPRVTVRAAGSDRDLAVYQPRFWGDGELALADGAAFQWRAVNFWSTRWSFLDGASRPLVTFRSGVEGQSLKDIFRTQATVEIDPAASAHPRLPLLVALGWYLILLQHQDTATTAGTVAAMG
jgi:hypothetical protein